MANCGINFFLLSSIVSLEKAAMNAARICKLCNGALVNCGGIEFFKEKDLIPVRNEYSPQLSKFLYNCKLKNKEAL